MRTIFWKALSRNLNVSWTIGVFLFQIFSTEAYAHRLWEKQFAPSEYPTALCVGLMALSVGAVVLMLLRRPLEDRRYAAPMRLAGIFLYLLALFWMASTSVPVVFLLARCANGIVMGYWFGAVCEKLLLSKSFDRYLGLMIGGGFFLFFAGLMLAGRFFSVGTSLVMGFCFLVYLCFRQPIEQLPAVSLYPREDLREIRRYDVLGHTVLFFLLLLSNCLFFVWCAKNRWDYCSAATCWIWYAAFGAGMLAGGALRDRLTRLFPLLVPLAVGFLPFAALLIYADGPAGIWGMFGMMGSLGMSLCCFFCDGIELAALHGIHTTRQAVRLCAVLILPGLCVGLAFILTERMSSLAVLAVYVLAETMFLLLWFGYLLLKGGNEEKPPMPFDIRLSAFCEEYALSPREGEVLEIVLSSTKNMRDLAECLFISSRTLEKHMANIYKKTSAKNRSDLVRMFYAEEMTGAG